MKYFIDTEFIEGFWDAVFYKKRHFIDLIYIGIVAEDGRKYYAISNEYKFSNADKWVQENVILPMYKENVSGDQRNNWNATNFHFWVGKSNATIAAEIIDFINPKIQDLIDVFTRHDSWMEEYYEQEFAYVKKHNTKIPDHYYKSGSDGYIKNRALIYNQPEFYGYYADYDWVLFCSLFGRMIDLPKGFPMYCKDLKQMFDEVSEERNNKNYNSSHPSTLISLKEYIGYPKQENEHNALADAKWNYELYKFLQSLDV